MGGNDNDSGGQGAGVYLIENVLPVHVGQLQIQQDGIGNICCDSLQCRFPGIDMHDLVILLAQVLLVYNSQ